MGFFDLFRKKKKPSNDDAVFNKMADMLFGGTAEFRSQVLELHALLNQRYEPSQVANALTWMTLEFNREGDRSSGALVDEGQMRRPTNPFSREDALKIYRFVAKKNWEKMFPGAPEALFESMYIGLGNSEDGCTTDVIPGAYGEFGYDLTNPVPTRGVPANLTYLRSLRLLSGEKLKWERIGSFSAPNIDNPIDGYEIMTLDGKPLCTIYISPYQRVISKQAPKGFYLA